MDRTTVATSRSRRLVVFVALAAACGGEQAVSSTSVPPTPVPPTVETATVSRYSVFEQTFSRNSAGYANPWEDVTATMTFTSPSSKQVTVGGFYYGPNTWKARFAPSEVGNWTWQADVGDAAGTTRSNGKLIVTASDAPGFVRSNQANRFRWVFDDGTSYNALGIGDCIRGVTGGTSMLNQWGFDGDFRTGGQGPGKYTDFDTYLSAHSQAGINLFRWSVDNCAFGLYKTIATSGNVYLEKEGLAGDTLVGKLRQYGFRTYMVIFGFNPPSTGQTLSPGDLAAIKRYVKYVVDRYGASVDFWELMNEAFATDDWYRQVATYLREIDPYKHPISTSWEKPGVDVIDINSPHWYEKESEFESDRVTWTRFGQFRSPATASGWKASNKPVIVGEQGNIVQNWDDRSALRMRLRTWTTFFAEGTLIFWNGSFAKDYRSALAANIYLGPEERGYLKVLQDFTRGFDPNLAQVEIPVSDPARVRAYALSSSTTYAAFVHAYTNHTTPTSGITLSIDARGAGTATWIEPATGRVLATQAVAVGRQTLAVPAFVTDVALKVR